MISTLSAPSVRSWSELLQNARGQYKARYESTVDLTDSTARVVDVQSQPLQTA